MDLIVSSGYPSPYSTVGEELKAAQFWTRPIGRR